MCVCGRGGGLKKLATYHSNTMKDTEMKFGWIVEKSVQNLEVEGQRIGFILSGQSRSRE